MLSNTMNASILPHYLCFLKCFQHNIDNGQFQMASGLSTVNTVRETSAFSHSMKQTDDGVLDVIVQNMMQGVTQSALLENNYSRILARSMEVSFCIRRSKRCFIQLVLVPLPSEFQDQLFKTANSESGKWCSVHALRSTKPSSLKRSSSGITCDFQVASINSPIPMCRW